MSNNFYLGDVECAFLHIVAILVLAIIVILGMVKLIRGKIKSNTVSIMAVCAIILPLLLVYNMFFSGYCRSVPLSTDNVEKCVTRVTEFIIEKEDGYFEKLLKDDKIVSYKFKDVNLRCDVHISPDIDYSSNHCYENLNFLEKVQFKMFGKMGTCNGVKYYCPPLCTDRGESLSSYHIGYNGMIIFNANGYSVCIVYEISRPVDLYFGFFFAPPIFKNFDLGGLIQI